MYSIHPGLILILTGMLVLLIGQKTLRQWVALAGPVLALVSMVALGEQGSLNYAFAGDMTMKLLCVDGLSRAFGLIFCIIAVIAGIYGFRRETRGEMAASLIYGGSSICVVFAGDWISLICFWEVMAVSSWYLVWAGGTHRAKRASYRYLVMHFFGGNMLLAGAMVLCAEGNFDVGSLTGGSGWGYWLVLLGVAVNGAIPPLHTWVADAYPESTPSGTVYMGSYTTKVAIYALIRLFAGTEALVIVGAVMAVLAACMALIENDLRRLLSYHIVSQLGMMVAALGTGLAAGIDGAALHAAFNILYKGVLLMGAGAVIAATGKRKISELGGLWRKMPLVSICFLIASLAIAGMPFLNGFASKALIMEALEEGGYTLSYWLVTLAGVGTWLSITLKINYFVFFGKTDRNVTCRPVPLSMKLAMVLGSALCVVTGLFPDIAYSLMPNQTMADPFTLHHILEYVGLFIGASVPFALLIGKMAPHDMLTLDFDWFYRRPLAKLVFGLSARVHQAFIRFDVMANGMARIVKTGLNTPKEIFRSMETWQDEEDSMPVGGFMQLFLLFLVIAFVEILIME